MAYADTLKRDPEYIGSLLVEGKDGRLYAEADLKIHVPVRYREHNLATINSDGVFVLGVFAIIAGDRYAVNMTAASIRLTPDETQIITIDKEQYYEFTFPKGTSVFYTVDLVVVKNILFYIFSEFIERGKTPWFMNYDDRLHLFDTQGMYAGAELMHPLIMDMLISMTARSMKDPRILYRHIVKDKATALNNPPLCIPFTSVLFNTHSTLSRLTGNYFDDAVNVSLTDPSETVEPLEDVLRR